MGDLKIVYQVSLTEEQDADVFETFMKDRYFPAVRKLPTRVGQVTGLALWRGVADTHESAHTFLVHMSYAGMAFGELIVDDDEVQAAFEAFGAPLERLGAYDERVVWPEDAGS
jgi:hypothetical protein